MSIRNVIKDVGFLIGLYIVAIGRCMGMYVAGAGGHKSVTTTRTEVTRATVP
jgi:UPF0716 family protein affecting phage T7 exclusion